jgi:tRNA(Ile)-lysidine synthase
VVYHFRVHPLAARLLETIRKHEWIRPGDRVAVAVSGGADSVALLCLLLELRSELGCVLSVAHVNHGLRGEESAQDEQFVANLAEAHGLELHRAEAAVRGKGHAGVEAAARKFRYEFFRELARSRRAGKIATAHTLDDQAETVLLRLFRGTGLRGLSGIHGNLRLEENGRTLGEVVRPLLSERRSGLRDFLRERGQSWREDSSNLDTTFLRNRVRHRLLPLIVQEYGQAAIEHMSELAEIARAEDEHWRNGHPETRVDIPAGGSEAREEAALLQSTLLALPLAAQRRVVLSWLEANAPGTAISFRRVEEVLDLALGAAGRKLELTPGRWLRRQAGSLRLELDASGGHPADYEYALAVPGRVDIPELSACMEARIVDAREIGEDEREQLLNADCVANEVLIRNWRPGDRYWPAHTPAEKKVKQLLTERHATGAQKKLWPVAVTETGLLWMRGFPVRASLRAPATAPRAIWIREIRG